MTELFYEIIDVWKLAQQKDKEVEVYNDHISIAIWHDSYSDRIRFSNSLIGYDTVESAGKDIVRLLSLRGYKARSFEVELL